MAQNQLNGVRNGGVSKTYKKVSRSTFDPLKSPISYDVLPMLDAYPGTIEELKDFCIEMFPAATAVEIEGERGGALVRVDLPYSMKKDTFMAKLGETISNMCMIAKSGTNKVYQDEVKRKFELKMALKAREMFGENEDIYASQMVEKM